jgi:hypothetical protein
MTTTTIDKVDILDTLNAAEDYGYFKPIILQTLTAWYGPITVAEIAAFAESYLEEDGYNENDVDFTIENITYIFKMYGKIIDA